MDKQNQNLRLVTLLMSVVCLASCGGSDDSSGAKCAVGAACGGDVVGTWQIQESCAYGNFIDQMDAMCSSATIDGSALKLTGTMKFNADKSYTSNTVLNGTMKMTMPASCLEGEDGESLSCSQFGAFFTAIFTLAGGANGEITAECSGTSTCACNFKFKDAKADDEGTYATNGTKITITASDDEEDEVPETSDYCVQGSSLTMSQAATAGSSGNSSLKLTKK